MDNSWSSVVVLGCYLLLVAGVSNVVLRWYGMFSVFLVPGMVALLFKVVQFVPNCFGIF